MKKALLLASLVLGLAGFSGQAWGKGGESAGVSFGQPVVIGPGETSADDVVSFFGNIDIAGEVNGDCVAMGGSVKISGRVNGDVVAIGGGVSLGSDSVVSGDVVSIGGTIFRDHGARVMGQRVTISPFPGWAGFSRFPTPFAGLAFLGGAFLLFLIGYLVLVLLVTAVFPVPVERVSDYLSAWPGRSLLAGFLGIICILPVLLVLVISLVGILLIPLAIILLIAAFILGDIGVSALVGRRVQKALNRKNPSLLAAVLIGKILLAVVGLIPVLGKLVVVLAAIFGFGAVLMTRFGTVKDKAGPVVVPAGGPVVGEEKR